MHRLHLRIQKTKNERQKTKDQLVFNNTHFLLTFMPQNIVETSCATYF